MSSLHSESQSADSSLQRCSALNISVGDTKSIVLALQALQSKIRQLEKDRDYHHDQYEQAIRNHETFKSLLESRMEEERTIHRIREKELSELLRKAIEEKTQITAAGCGTRAALSQLREELEIMMEAERKASKEREQKLVLEIEKLQEAVQQEKRAHAGTLLKLQNLNTPAQPRPPGGEGSVLSGEEQGQPQDRRHPLCHSTRHDDSLVGSRETRHRSASLRSTSDPSTSRRDRMQEEHNENGMRHSGTTSSPQSHSSRSRLDDLLKSSGYHSQHDNSRSTPPLSSRYSHHYSSLRWKGGTPSSKGDYASPVSFEVEYINNYQDPTCNSLLRDVRNVSGLAPCLHPANQCFSSEIPHKMRSPFKARGGNSPETNAAALKFNRREGAMKTPTSRSPHTSVIIANTPLRRTSNSARQASRRGGRFPVWTSPSRHRMHDVTEEESLRKEIDDLNTRLNHFLVSSSTSKMSVKEMRYYFQKLAIRLARKEEHLALLMRNSSLHRSSRTGMNWRRNEIRQSVMNEMREITSNALKKR